MKYAIVTGVSRGLGASIAMLLLQSGVHVIGVARNNDESLAEIAESNGVSYHFYNCDLGNMEELENVTVAIKQLLREKSFKTLYMINNAAVLDPIEPAHRVSIHELSHHIQVNVTAPIHLMNTFLDFGTTSDSKLIGVMITSGAANRPIYGWSLYGSTKASINAFTQTVSLEQSILRTKHQIIAFSPGVMDTDMQAMIRMSSTDQFVDVDTFKAYKENNQLRHPDDVAQVLIDIIMDESNIKNGHVYNVNDFLIG